MEEIRWVIENIWSQVKLEILSIFAWGEDSLLTIPHFLPAPVTNLLKVFKQEMWQMGAPKSSCYSYVMRLNMGRVISSQLCWKPQQDTWGMFSEKDGEWLGFLFL